MFKKYALIVVIASVLWFVVGCINVNLATVLLLLYIVAIICLLAKMIVKTISKITKNSRKKKRRVSSSANIKSDTKAKKEKKIEKSIKWPEEMDGKACAYRYENVGVYLPNESIIEDIELFDCAVLSREPENEYDPKAVAVYGKNARTGEIIKIGYLYRGKIQSMANEWDEKEYPIFCQISLINKSSINPSKDGVKINISFYK